MLKKRTDPSDDPAQVSEDRTDHKAHKAKKYLKYTVLSLLNFSFGFLCDSLLELFLIEALLVAYLLIQDA